ncbi:MAG: hypothetical protein ACU0CO_10880 [Shimia sp.]
MTGARGWRLFDAPDLGPWRAAAHRAAHAAVTAPETARWLRCSGTWFAGVNVLANGPDGAVPGGPPLPATILDAAGAMCPGPIAWDRGQVSVVYPGYPQPMEGEGPGAFRYRRDRDAAHVDGLLPVGPERRRMMREPHAFVLGIPLTEATGSPMVVWEGSHEVIRAAFGEVLADVPPTARGTVDLTEVYQATRRRIFETCRRVELRARPGQAYLLHRLALHGVAPWAEEAEAPPEGRMIVYFRPALPDGADWLALP